MSIVMLLRIISLCFLIYFLFKRFSNKNSTNTSETKPEVPEIDATVPDLPVGFGYKCSWIAVKTDHKMKIVELLKLKSHADCNWKVGVRKAYDGEGVFITPVIDGWTLIVGTEFIDANGDKNEIVAAKQILQSLSQEFGEAQYFATHRVVEYHCWIKATHGNIERAYAYLGESGENIVVEGTPTDFEKNIHLINTFSEEAKQEGFYEREDIIYPDEDLVMKVAANWSIDPSDLDSRSDLAPSIGLLGSTRTFLDKLI